MEVMSTAGCGLLYGLWVDWSGDAFPSSPLRSCGPWRMRGIVGREDSRTRYPLRLLPCDYSLSLSLPPSPLSIYLYFLPHRSSLSSVAGLGGGGGGGGGAHTGGGVERVKRPGTRSLFAAGDPKGRVGVVALSMHGHVVDRCVGCWPASRHPENPRRKHRACMLWAGRRRGQISAKRSLRDRHACVGVGGCARARACAGRWVRACARGSRFALGRYV